MHKKINFLDLDGFCMYLFIAYFVTADCDWLSCRGRAVRKGRLDKTWSIPRRRCGNDGSSIPVNAGQAKICVNDSVGYYDNKHSYGRHKHIRIK